MFAVKHSNDFRSRRPFPKSIGGHSLGYPGMLHQARQLVPALLGILFTLEMRSKVLFHMYGLEVKDNNYNRSTFSLCGCGICIYQQWNEEFKIFMFYTTQLFCWQSLQAGESEETAMSNRTKWEGCEGEWKKTNKQRKNRPRDLR